MIRKASVTAVLVPPVLRKHHPSHRPKPARYNLMIRRPGKHAPVYATTLRIDDIVDAARTALADEYGNTMAEWHIAAVSIKFPDPKESSCPAPVFS